MYREIIKARLLEQTRKIRRELGLSQERMSEQLRITTRAYGDLERGKYCFSAFALLFLLKLSGKEECWELALSVCGEACRNRWSNGLSGSVIGDFRQDSQK